ncbi:MAG: hypothetical protein KIB00_16890 [Paeniclostridium sordellii]|nr:hypothetical protein [Paeniclostridium sordellii]
MGSNKNLKVKKSFTQMQEIMSSEERQKAINKEFNSIRSQIKEFSEEEIISSMDSTLITDLAISMVKLGELYYLYNLEKQERNYKDMERVKKLLDAERNTLRKGLYDLGMTPESRARFADIILKRKENEGDELLNLLRGNNTEENMEEDTNE